jgi:cell division transport system ATP-binding protein
MISFSQVRKSFLGGHEALAKLSFSVEPGEMVFITGRSAAW